jgi:hypothetical protein
MFGRFSNKPAAPQQQQQQQQQQQPSASGNQLPNTQKPEQMPGTDQLPPNPLDVYAKLWDNTSNTEANQPPRFQVDPKVIGDVSSNLDFTKDVPQELMQKAQTGDMQALMSMMNHVARGAYQSALQHNMGLTDKFIDARSSYDQQAISGRVKSEMVTSSFKDIPNSHHPVVKSELKRIAEAMQKQYPEAHPDEIVQHTKEYWKLLQDATTGKPQENAPTAGAETDWDKFF